MMVLAPSRRVARAVVVAGLAAGVVGCGGDGDDTAPKTVATAPTSSTAPPTTLAARMVDVVVRRGSVEGGGRHEVRLNERVRVRVTSDVADEVHVHGYEHRFAVGPTGPADITFIANVPGVFEVELEKARRGLFNLEVRP